VSRERLDDHRRIWSEKPVLERVYEPWFNALLAEAGPRQRVLEVGAGPGFLAAHARARRPDVRWVASDVLAVPWNDMAADAGRLPFAPASFDAVICLDLVHHLARPRDFFAEAARVLRPGGRIAAIEPWVSPMSYPIYRWLHEEGCDLRIDPWNPFAGRAGAKEAFEGNGALAWRVVRSGDARQWAAMGLQPPRVRALNAFAYLMSLGFRKGSLLPASLVPLARRVDDLTRPVAPLTAMRAMIVWDRLI
jgi:SAM-dependent methyltransferase